MRNKRLQPLRIEGQHVVLEEITPRFFPYVIAWRNHPELNRYLNQPKVLTEEEEFRWYDNDYLNDDTQGMMMMVDAYNGVVFGTCGWTHMDYQMKRCISGRILRGDGAYKGTGAFYESFILLADYLYQFVDVMYAHVVKDNIPSLRLHESLGFVYSSYEFQYPNERYVNDMEQIEFFRTKSRYVEFRNIIMQLFDEHNP